MTDALRIGIVGCGYFGCAHAQKYMDMPQAELVAVTDRNPAAALSLANQYGIEPVRDASDLVGRVDAVSVVVPTADHFAVTAPLLDAGLHVLVEKPIAATAEQAMQLIDVANRQRAVLQVGHVERFNAIVLALEDVIRQPMFIEAYRIAPFKRRGTDVDVILDSMIHDIDLIQYLVDAPLQHVDAVGTPVLSAEDDIVNARLKFDGNRIANVTASRAGFKQERKMRLFQRDAYISIDLHASTAMIARRRAGQAASDIPEIDIEHRQVDANDPLARELEAFVDAVCTGRPAKVSGLEGLRALETAMEITRALQRPHVRRVSDEGAALRGKSAAATSSD